MDKTTLILKRDELGRVRTPVEKRAMVVEEFKRSGLSARKFAQLAGVHYNTFWNWLHEQGLTARRGEKGRQSKPRLVEVCMDPMQACPPPSPVALHIALPGGAQMMVRDAAQVLLAAQLIKALA
jgi:hypothetical protein